MRGAHVRERVGSWLIAACLTFAMASPAWADAKVSVELKAKDGSPTDGEVLLTKGDAKFSCKTSAGHCEISGVPGGMYTVEVKQEGKPSPKPKQVMIPPSGDTKLIVNAS
jgi:hypothetical protein